MDIESWQVWQAEIFFEKKKMLPVVSVSQESFSKIPNKI